MKYTTAILSLAALATAAPAPSATSAAPSVNLEPIIGGLLGGLLHLNGTHNGTATTGGSPYVPISTKASSTTSSTATPSTTAKPSSSSASSAKPSSTSYSVEVQTSSNESPEASAEAQNAAQVQCPAYGSADPTLHAKALAPCNPYCGNLEASKNSSTGSVTCLGAEGVGAPIYYKDDDGNQYMPGVCRCDLPILDEMADIFVEAAAAAGAIGCEIMYKTFNAILDVATTVIPVVGPELAAADAGMQTAVKTATQIAKVGKKGKDFLDLFPDPCPDVSQYFDNADDLFNPLVGKGKPGGRAGKSKA